MKRIILILCVFSYVHQSFGQAKYWKRLRLGSTDLQLNVTSSEEIWITPGGSSAMIHHTSKFGKAFRPIDLTLLPSRKPDNVPNQTLFFNQDTLMISTGPTYNDRHTNQMYWSGDRGKTWKKIKWPLASEVNTACGLANGKAWIADQDANIFYSSDSGQNWIKVGQIQANEYDRIQQIYFDHTAQTGFLMLTMGALYRTKDLGKTWKVLPTPASQNKYRKIYKNEEEQVEKIQRLGGQYLIKQQNLVLWGLNKL